MKYRKPQTAIGSWLNFRSEGAARDLSMFLNSLPPEFEIVEPGMTQVRWPEGWTREYLLRSSRGEYGDGVSLRAWLEALAAIAPVEKKKKRMVALYEFLGHGYGSTQYGAIVGFTYDGPMPGGFPWRKVGECEVDT